MTMVGPPKDVVVSSPTTDAIKLDSEQKSDFEEEMRRAEAATVEATSSAKALS